MRFVASTPALEKKGGAGKDTKGMMTAPIL